MSYLLSHKTLYLYKKLESLKNLLPTPSFAKFDNKHM